jgi:hypothetical protein
MPRRDDAGGEDPSGDAAAGMALLAEASSAILVGVGATLPGWSAVAARRILDAWDRHDASERDLVVGLARSAGEEAARRIGAELERLFALDPDEQPSTPLQVVRTAYREVTAVLRGAGIPPVERDEFARRSWPDDDFGLAIASLADLGDEELRTHQIAWGVAKAAVHRARRPSG